MRVPFRALIPLLALPLIVSTAWGAPARKVIIDQDTAGPGGSNMQAILELLQARDVEVVGITVASGDQWRDEELAHVLRLLEIAGRTDVPVYSGAEFPLVRTRAETKLWEQLYGKVAYEGAWDDRWWHEPSVVPPLAEGRPTTKPAEGNAAGFLVRMVHRYPGEITIYEGAPMTNLALAISLDPSFPTLAKELVFMGGGLNPESDYIEMSENPRHEFNFWFDPEAAQIVLRAPWKRIVCTPTDVSIKTRLTAAWVKRIGRTKNPVAEYVERYFKADDGNDIMWDELAAAAWLDPSLITKKERRYMTVDLDKGAGYGNTITFIDPQSVKLPLQPVDVQLDVDTERFYALFAKLMEAPVRAAASAPK